MSDDFFSYSPDTFPFDPDRYDWPKVEVGLSDGQAFVLNIHCIRDIARRKFTLVGFVNVDREEQISQVIHLAQSHGAQVIMFRGVGFTDEIIQGLLSRLMTSDDYPGQKITLLTPHWPTRFQYKMLREAEDMCRHGDFHEASLAYRLHAPVEEIHQYLELLVDLGLMEAAQ